MESPAPGLLAPGTQLDRYELLCPIAEGGMASVWIARQRGKHGFARLVAVKTILPQYASDPKFQNMFRDEARISSRIQHGNVVEVLDVGEQHGTTYLVMEYVDGDALVTIQRTVKKRGAQVPLGVVLRVMADVCGGLHAAHELRDETGRELGVVHRDVSPHNILVSGNGDAKLIDFGIAKVRDRVAAGDTYTGTVKGKIRYMAPEQALGNPLDRRADLWAIGAILYESLSGRPPYDFGHDVQTILALTGQAPPPPLPSSVPRPIADVVHRALSKAAGHRFATAAEMQEAIEAAMIAVNVTTSAGSVAAFLAEHMAGRAKHRKEAIALGLSAAVAREQYASILRIGVTALAPSFTGGRSKDLEGPVRARGEDATEVVEGHTDGDDTLGSATMATRSRRALPRRTTIKVAALSAAAGLAVTSALALAHPASFLRARTRAPAVTSVSVPPAPSREPERADVVAPPAPADPAPSRAGGDGGDSPAAGPKVRGRPKAHGHAPRAAKPSQPGSVAPAKPRIDDGF